MRIDNNTKFEQNESILIMIGVRDEIIIQRVLDMS